MNKKFYDEQFQARLRTPGVWALSARRLRRAAEIIFDHYGKDLRDMEAGVSPVELENLEISGCGTLLYGLAVENILKGILLSTSQDAIDHGKLRKWPGGGHDLVLLAAEAKITLSVTEEDILKRLSACVRWAGRYPIPKKSEKMGLSQCAYPSGDSLPMPLEVFEQAAFDAMYIRFESLILVRSKSNTKAGNGAATATHPAEGAHSPDVQV